MGHIGDGSNDPTNTVKEQKNKLIKMRCQSRNTADRGKFWNDI